MKTITRTITDPRILARYARETMRNYMDNDVVKFIKSMIPLYEAWLKAEPPCPTCGGRAEVATAIGYDSESCPDCPDGIQPFDKWTAGLVALWEAVHDTLALTRLRHEAKTKTDADVIVALRQIGGAQ